MKKRVFACLLVAALLALTGCDTKKEADPQGADESTVSAEVVNPSEVENVSGTQNGQENIQMERTRAIWEKRATTDYMIDPSESMITTDELGVKHGEDSALANFFLEYISGIFDADIVFVCAANNDPSKDIEELAEIVHSENGFDEDCLMFYIDIDTNNWTILKTGNMAELSDNDRLTEIGERAAENFSENRKGYGLFVYIRELYSYLCKEKNIIAEGVAEGLAAHGIFEIQPGSECIVGVDERTLISTGMYLLYCNSHGRVKVTDSSGETIYYKYIPRTNTPKMSYMGLDSRGGGEKYLPKQSATDGKEISPRSSAGSNNDHNERVRDIEKREIREMENDDYFDLRHQGYATREEAEKRWLELEKIRVEGLEILDRIEPVSYEVGQPRVIGSWDDSAVEQMCPTENEKEYIYYTPYVICVKNGDVIEFEGNAPLVLVGDGYYLDDGPSRRVHEAPNLKVKKWLEAHGCRTGLYSYEDEVDWRSLP